jgi:deazaflavin-dependent oxidoreductase (nitroreductase family)
LIYARDGDDYLVVASMGGAPKHLGWYLNLTANPDVTVQVKGDRFAARARTATADERPRLWEVVNQVWPNCDVYATPESQGDPTDERGWDLHLGAPRRDAMCQA